MVANSFIVNSFIPPNIGKNLPTPPQYQDPIPDGDVPQGPPSLQVPDGSDQEFNPATVVLENFRGASYNELLNSFADADDNIGDSGSWVQIATNIDGLTLDFQDALSKLEDAEDWQGQTHDAMIANVRQSFAQPNAAASGARMLASLQDAFGQTISATKSNLIRFAGAYADSLNKFPNSIDNINNDFDTYAQKVMAEVYVPSIKDIAAKNAAFNPAPQAPESGSGSGNSDDDS